MNAEISVSQHDIPGFFPNGDLGRDVLPETNQYQNIGGDLEQADLDLITKHAKDNNQLDRLYKEHLRLGQEIEKIQSIRIKSAEEEKKLRELKKVKLEGRDQMEQIFLTLR